MDGRIVWISVIRGYGFIEAEDGGDDIYFPTATLAPGFAPQAGDAVAYQVIERDGGPEATAIRIIND